MTNGDNPEDDGTLDQNEGSTNGDNGAATAGSLFEAGPSDDSTSGSVELVLLLCSLRRAREVDISSKLRA